MAPLQTSRARDLPPAGEPFQGPDIDPSPVLGSWVNFDTASRGLARVVVAVDGDGDGNGGGDGSGGLRVRAFGAGFPEPLDWGEVPGQPFADGASLASAVAFTALYDFGSHTVTLACYLNKRLLVVDAYTRFQDGSGRSGYFARDHFYIP
jgi:hypothetical protein